MATNIVLLNVYQINNRTQEGSANNQSYTSKRLGFPTSGNILLWDTTNSPTRSLPTGVNVYSMIQIASSAAADASGTQYYVAETLSQLQSLFNA